MMKRKRAAVSVLTAVVMVSSMGVSASGVYMKPASTENADGEIYTYNSETDQYELLEDITDSEIDETVQVTSYLANVSTAIEEEASAAYIRKVLHSAGIYESTDSKYEIDSVKKYREVEYTWRAIELEDPEDKDAETNETYCYIVEKIPMSPVALIPNTLLGSTVVAVSGSVYVREFDLDPENKYMKCVDNVIFSKDGKVLMSYAQFDEKEIYTVPDGTEIIGRYALAKAGRNVAGPEGTCQAFVNGVFIADSVQCIEYDAFYDCDKMPKVVFMEGDNHLTIDGRAFADCDSLEEVILPNFDVEMDRSVFENSESLSRLTTYAQPTLTSDGTTIRWEEIKGATYYEVYQKLNDGEYRLLGTTSGGGCRFTTLKEGKEYTFAVKAYAEIPAANYDPETDDDDEVFLLGERVPSYRLKETYDADLYPESFLIEGTMSEDIVLVG